MSNSSRSRQFQRDPPEEGTASFLASIQRLQAAGLIQSVSHDVASGQGVISFTPATHRLLMAGRELFSEPAFLDVWLTGDPALIREWVEREAALLSPPDPGEGR